MSLVSAGETVRVRSLNRSAGKILHVRLLGSDRRIKWSQTDGAVELDFDGIKTGANGFVVEVTLQ